MKRQKRINICQMKGGKNHVGNLLQISFEQKPDNLSF